MISLIEELCFTIFMLIVIPAAASVVAYLVTSYKEDRW